MRSRIRSLIIKIQKKAVKFYNHLKGSDSQTFHNKAITYSEIHLENPKQARPGDLFTNTNRPHDSNTIRPNQRGPTAAPRSSAEFLSDLGPVGDSQ